MGIQNQNRMPTGEISSRVGSTIRNQGQFARTEHMITDQKGEERVTKEDFGTKDRERNTENLIN